LIIVVEAHTFRINRILFQRVIIHSSEYTPLKRYTFNGQIICSRDIRFA